MASTQKKAVSAATKKPAPKALGPRERFLAECAWGVTHTAQIHYEERRPIPVHLPKNTLPITTDCSGFVILMAKWAGDSDPARHGFNGDGFTGDFVDHLPEIHSRDAEPGDLIVYGGGTGHHVVVIEKRLPHDDFETISHGMEAGPLRVKHSVEAAKQQPPARFYKFLPEEI